MTSTWPLTRRLVVLAVLLYALAWVASCPTRQ